MLALGTITHQPDFDTDFRGYGEYITTDRFLVSHLGASIASAALGLLGIVAENSLCERSTTSPDGAVAPTACGSGPARR